MQLKDDISESFNPRPRYSDGRLRNLYL